MEACESEAGTLDMSVVEPESESEGQVVATAKPKAKSKSRAKPKATPKPKTAAAFKRPAAAKSKASAKSKPKAKPKATIAKAKPQQAKRPRGKNAKALEGIPSITSFMSTHEDLDYINICFLFPCLSVWHLCYRAFLVIELVFLNWVHGRQDQECCANVR